MLVADALNAVAAEAVVENGRALKRFAHAELHAGIAFLQKVARRHRTGGTGGEARARKTLAGPLHGLEEVCKGVAGDIVVPQRVAHLFKLVEDHHAGVLLELPGLVENLLDVGLAARRCDDLTGDLAEPLKALLAHLRGENGDRVDRQELGVECAAAAVVTGGGPHGVMIRRVELAGDEARGEAAERSANLVAARGEPLARHGEDAAGNAGELGRDLDIVRHLLEETAGLLGLVLPRDAEEVQRVDVPKADGLELFLNFLRDGLRMLHLRDGRDDNVVFLGLLNVVLQAGLVDGQIDLAHGSLLLLLFVNIRI